jgi:hypothetical protein
MRISTDQPGKDLDVIASQFILDHRLQELRQVSDGRGAEARDGSRQHTAQPAAGLAGAIRFLLGIPAPSRTTRVAIG